MNMVNQAGKYNEIFFFSSIYLNYFKYFIIFSFFNFFYFIKKIDK